MQDTLEKSQDLAPQKRLCYKAEKHNLQKGLQILFNFHKFQKVNPRRLTTLPEEPETPSLFYGATDLKERDEGDKATITNQHKREKL